MSIGPVQLLVLGFDDPDFRGDIVAELERLRENDGVSVLDALAVYKDADGELEVADLSTLPGRLIGRLVGLRIEGEAVDTAEGPERDGWEVLDDIPRDTAAALLLVEHRWAVLLRDAVTRTRGYRIADGFISPLDLVELGLLSAQEAQEQNALETGGT
jgi:hypothetical protein